MEHETKDKNRTPWWVFAGVSDAVVLQPFPGMDLICCQNIFYDIFWFFVYYYWYCFLYVVETYTTFFHPKGPAVILHVDDNNYVMTSLYSFWTPSSVPPISCVAGVPVIGSWVLLGVQVALSLQEDFWKQNMWTGRPIIYFTSRGQILSHGPYKTEGTMYL